MFDIPPKCPAIADKITGIFGWRHTYRVSQKHKGLSHTYLQKSYSLTLPKKTTTIFKEPDSWVVVHHLQTQSGILDPDDRLNDVADDREQILASFEDSGPDPGVQQGGGDGASGSSSVGTGSPDIFRDPTNTEATKRTTITNNINTNSNKIKINHNNNNNNNNNNTNTNTNEIDTTVPHIEVTSTTSAQHHGLGLQVRRSSDPNLFETLKNQSESTKRWSAAAPALCRSESPERILDKIDYLSPQWEIEDDDGQTQIQNPSQQTFARSGRLSMQFLGDGNGYKWMEAADKIAAQTMYTTKSLPRETGKRKEPLGQAYESIREKDGEMLLIINEYGGPLGLTAIPDREIGGLLVQNVEPGSRAERGRLRKGDRILEINGTKLFGMPEDQVQEYLKRSLAANELRVRVIRGCSIVGKYYKKDTKIAEMIEAEEKSTGTKVATVSPTKKLPGAPVGTTSLQAANTRKIGRKIEIILKKGPHGLGFSVTTRDNPAGGHCPIYIKNILPRGAAIEDGRLKPGDRLLEVDGLPMTGKSQSDVVGVLRATQPGATVRIVVSRQQELAEMDEREVNFSEEHEDAANNPPKPPAPIPPPSLDNFNIKLQNDFISQSNFNDQHFIDAGSESAASSDSLQAGIAWRHREVLTLHIPVHDTEKAGLGVSVKGKTSSGGNSSNGSSNSSTGKQHDGDLGIFVKSVLHGGAASRDGRLRMNDQLLSVNGISLLGQNNAEAMETLRRAMLHTSGKHPGLITLSVARKISRSHSSGDIVEQNDSSNTSENSGATVIYLSPDKRDHKDNIMNRWSNPVLDRLTGGICSSNSITNKRPSPLLTSGLRNESYYMATNDTWSPAINQLHHSNAINNSVLIEDDPEPMSPTLPNRPNDSASTIQSVNSNSNCGDATYSSQLSLDTNTSTEAFSRDAVGRRSISEKHHAAIDARETGTYQRNKKIREEREKERRIQLTKSAIISGSIESLARIGNPGIIKRTKNGQNLDLKLESLDQIGDLGPSLGLKKSSSLESLQTMVQEIQMSDEPRGGPSALRAPRGRGREEGLRAAVVAGSDTNKPRKHWLLEEDSDGGFVNRNGPFQSSLNDGKNKNRSKKPSILKGIGHMFRFGKHRKDGVVPIETVSEFGSGIPTSQHGGQQTGSSNSKHHQQYDHRQKSGPPIYQPPPPPISANTAGAVGGNASGSNHQNDIFNQRYQHYVNYEELQQQISRRHQHYHSQRSPRPEPTTKSHHPASIAAASGRPMSSFYEYETVQHHVTIGNNNGTDDIIGNGRIGITTNNNHHISNGPVNRKISAPSPPRQWKAATLNGLGQTNYGGSGRNRGPFITQVTIRDQSQIVTGPQKQQQQSQQQQHSYHHHHASGQQPHASKV